MRQHAVDRRAVQRRDRVRQAAAARLPAARAASTDATPRVPASTSRSRAPASAGATQLPDEVVERLAFELQVIGDMGFSLVLPHRVGPHRATPATPASASARAVAARPAARWPTACASPTSTRSSTTCCSSASSTRRRISMPDIDMDFDSRYRDEMIRYAAERYGRDHVAQIVTFSTIKARAAVRDAARVLGYPYAVGDKVAKAMPPLIMGRDTPLYACLEPHPKFEDGYKMAAELRDMYETDPDAQAGHRRRQGPRGPAPPGRHPRRRGGDHQGAAHRVPARSSASPSRAGPRGRAGRHPVRDARRRGPRPAQDGLPRPAQPRRHHRHRSSSSAQTRGVDARHRQRRRSTTAKTYELLQPGRHHRRVPARGRRRCGRSCARWRPTTFEDVAALVALYRPGPMAANMHNDYADRKNGRKPVEYLHPDAEEILGDTYGLMIYQESMMRVAQKFAGYSLAEADNLRKACGKKIRELIAKEREKFVAGCEATGYGARARATSCSTSSSRSPTTPSTRATPTATATSPTRPPTSRRTTRSSTSPRLLTSVKANLDKAAVYLDECRTMGIQVAVPDVNLSEQRLHAGRSRPTTPATSRSHPLRPVGGAQRGRGPRRATSSPSARPTARSPTSTTSATGRHPGAQQAHHRVADQGRRVRRARPSPQGPARRVRADHRPHGRPPPRARHGRHDLFGVRRRRRPGRRLERTPIPDLEFDKRSGWRSRRRCSASTSATTR